MRLLKLKGKRLHFRKKGTWQNIMFFNCYQIPLTGGQNYTVSNCWEIFLYPNNLTVVNCTHQRLWNVVHISKLWYGNNSWSHSTIKKVIFTRRLFYLASFGKWRFWNMAMTCFWLRCHSLYWIGFQFSFWWCARKNHKETRLLQQAIYMVQNRHAGEQKSHWDKINKGNYHLNLLMYAVFYLSLIGHFRVPKNLTFKARLI